MTVNTKKKLHFNISPAGDDSRELSGGGPSVSAGQDGAAATGAALEEDNARREAEVAGAGERERGFHHAVQKAAVVIFLYA